MAGNKNNSSDIILYTSPEGNIKVEVVYSGESFWLTQKRMAELFCVDRSVITKHLKNIFITNELAEDSACANFAHTAEDGKTYQTYFYNLDAIIAAVPHLGNKMDAFLQFNEYKILKDAGKVSHEVAKKLAEQEYEKYRVHQDKNFESDFDKVVKNSILRKRNNE